MSRYMSAPISTLITGLALLTLVGCTQARPQKPEATTTSPMPAMDAPPGTEEMVVKDGTDDEKMEDDTMVDDNSVQDDERGAGIPEPTPDEEDAMHTPMPDEQASEPRTIMLHSSNWEFSPSTIMLKKGEEVSLHLMGIEGNHGFAVPGLSVNASMSQGSSSTVKIPTDTAGTYEFFCSVPCGAGHKDMKGTIVIE